MESSLNDLCLILKESNSIELEINELKDDGIFRAKNYLKKVCKINFPDSSHEWNEIEKLNRLRNCLVHAGGNIKKSSNQTKIENIVKDSNTVSIKEDYLNFTNKYIEDAIENVRKFLSNIFRENVEHSFYSQL